MPLQSILIITSFFEHSFIVILAGAQRCAQNPHARRLSIDAMRSSGYRHTSFLLFL